MPQARMLSKKISHDEKVANLSLPATLLYTWCIPYLDVKGRIHGDQWSLKGIVPHVNELTPQKIDKCVDELVSCGLVTAYGNKQKYLQFSGFFNNQKIYEDKEAKSVIPDPTPDQLLTNSRQTPAQVKESKVKESKVKETVCGFFEKIWEKYPKKVDKKSALRHYNASVKNDQDCIRMEIALKNYLSSERVSRGFIQNGSTWFNQWEDWVEFKEDVCKECKGKGKFVSKTGYEIICKCPAGSRK